jgi:uncharacterized membrane protein
MFLVHSPISFSSLKLYKPAEGVARFYWAAILRRISQLFVGLFSSVYIYELLIKVGFEQKDSIVLLIAFLLFLLFSKLFFWPLQKLKQEDRI